CARVYSNYRSFDYW
nr:immunoglobulin heavy chain junction region [Mus musculus]